MRSIEPQTKKFINYNKEAEAFAKQCTPAQVPSLDHLSIKDYESVYPPSDDTFLLLDALGVEFDNPNDCKEEKSRKVLQICNTVEIGCGTGVCTIYLANVLQKYKEGIRHYVTDINQKAIDVALETAKVNGVSMQHFFPLKCDLATPLLSELEGKVDVFLFNPPYVPTPDDEVGSEGIEASWAGGTNGRIVLDRALPQIAKLLSWPHGTAYVITVDDNKPEEISKLMMDSYGISVIPLVRRKAYNEYLTVVKMTLTRNLQI
jgi:release factor glutamine methyltransferase